MYMYIERYIFNNVVLDEEPWTYATQWISAMCRTPLYGATNDIGIILKRISSLHAIIPKICTKRFYIFTGLMKACRIYCLVQTNHISQIFNVFIVIATERQGIISPGDPKFLYYPGRFQMA